MYLNFEAQFWLLTHFAERSGQQEFSCLIFLVGQRYNKAWNFEFFWYCSSIKTDMVQTFKNIFPFSGMKFQDFSKILRFCCHFVEFWGNWHFSIPGMPFQWPLCAFSSLLTTLSHCSFFIYTFWSELMQSKSALNHRFSALKILCFRVKKISAEKRWFRADFLWNRADQPWCPSCSLKQCWKTSNLWNSAIQSWLPLGFQPGMPFRLFCLIELNRTSCAIPFPKTIISTDITSEKLWPGKFQRWSALIYNFSVGDHRCFSSNSAPMYIA